MKEFIHKPRRAPWDANDTQHKAHPPRGGTPKELEDWATLRWETILHYVVGLGKVHLDLKDEASPLVRDVRGVPSLIIDMLENCMLLDVTTDRDVKAQYESFDFDRKTEITQIGYEWMLKNTTSQLWLLLIIYLDGAGGSGDDEEDEESSDESGGDSSGEEGGGEEEHRIMLGKQISILHLMFRIRCMKLGDSFMYDELNEVQQESIDVFEGLGMIRKIKRSGSGDGQDEAARRMIRMALYPTHLGMTCMQGAFSSNDRAATTNATNHNENVGSTSSSTSVAGTVLTMASSSSSASSTVPLHVIVETNFHIYIYLYTESPMYEELLKYFIDIEFYTPNMICGMMTRQSVKSAMDKGITAQQILDFIQEHAHPTMIERAQENNKGSSNSRNSVVPENVRDQLMLWFQETKKFAVNDAKLYNNFESVELYRMVLEYANKKGALLASYDSSTSNILEQQQISSWMTIKSKHHNDIKRFIKEQRNGGGN